MRRNSIYFEDRDKNVCMILPVKNKISSVFVFSPGIEVNL